MAVWNIILTSPAYFKNNHGGENTFASHRTKKPRRVQALENGSENSALDEHDREREQSENVLKTR